MCPTSGVGSATKGRYTEWLLESLDADFGAAIALNHIFEDNEEMLRDVSSVVEKYFDLIKRLGGREKYLQFFLSLCTCKGSTIRVNQELVCSMLSRFSECRLQLSLEEMAGVSGAREPTICPARRPSGAGFIDCRVL